MGHRDGGGLNPNRQRGFGQQRRIETPTLNEMRARQGAVVGKFMNFMHRKNTLVIEIYERAFYNKKPNWDQLASFVYNDLCPSAELRQNLEDVQLHPVKILVFIKFKSEGVRDQVVASMQSMNRVLWTEYGVKVKGYSLDSKVKVITILGVSPESTSEEVKNSFLEAGIGEVMELDRGLLDANRLPGVTNGKWVARVKIEDTNKQIPSYIIRKEEGELWSLNFEGRRFVCWKCGSSEHIGDKCRDQEKTFEEVFGENEAEPATSWAAIVKGSAGVDPDALARREAFAKQIRENNERRAREKRESEERKQLELEEKERQKRTSEIERQEALAEAAVLGQNFVDQEMDRDDDNIDDNLLAQVAEESVAGVMPLMPTLAPRGDEEGGGGGAGGEDDQVAQENIAVIPVLPAMAPIGNGEGEGGRADEGDDQRVHENVVGDSVLQAMAPRGGGEGSGGRAGGEIIK